MSDKILQELSDAATPGPWSADQKIIMSPDKRSVARTHLPGVSYAPEKPSAVANAAYITALVNAHRAGELVDASILVSVRASRDQIAADKIELRGELSALRAKFEKLADALESISCWRRSAHDYDDDMGHARRTFDEDDLRMVEGFARAALAEYRGEVE